MVLHTTYPEVWIANTRECVFWNDVNDDDDDNDVNDVNDDVDFPCPNN